MTGNELMKRVTDDLQSSPVPTVCFMVAVEQVFKNGPKVPDKVVSGVNSPGNSCEGFCLV